jgi:short-subunit dehydrogenase
VTANQTKARPTTGAGRGMGAGFARAALSAGHNVVATGRDTDAVRAAHGEHGRLLVAGFFEQLSPGISISSTAGVVGGAFASAYAASKFGLEGRMEGLGSEVDPVRARPRGRRGRGVTPMCEGAA